MFWLITGRLNSYYSVFRTNDGGNDVEYLFPFESVACGENVVIYGAGKVGECFFRQIRKSNYCNVVCIIDKNAEKVNFYNARVLPLKHLHNCSYDKLIIAINDYMEAENAREFLVSNCNVAKEKIVMGCGRGLSYPETEKSVVLDTGTEVSFLDKEFVNVAFCLSAGLGDMIIAKKFIEEFIGLSDKIKGIDLYIPLGAEDKCQAIFYDSVYVHGIFIGDVGDLKKYDVCIYVEYFLTLRYLNIENIKKKDCSFAEQMEQLKEKVIAYGLKFPMDNRIHFDRCRFLGRNAYTAYNYCEILHISDWHVDIPMLEDNKNSYKKLGLRRVYITVNFGWGTSVKGKGDLPNKVWPLEYYEKFLSLFRKRFRKCEIIQLGLLDSPRILGTDSYVFGESLETVKYVLKNSLLHVDCEGGLVHLATQLGTKCIVLFGPTPVYYFGYDVNINIVSTECRDCYFLEKDFSACVRCLDKKACMYGIKPETVMEKAGEYIESLGDICG